MPRPFTGWRFYTEFISFYDDMRYSNRSLSSHHLRPFALGAITQFNFAGQWAKSKASTGNDAKFAAGWNEYMYKVVDLYDEKDTYDKVRTKYYRHRLKFEAKGQLERVMAWNATNKYAVGLKIDATSHRAQLVFKPVSRENLLDTNNWTERAVDFGLDKMNSSQSFSLLVYVSALKSAHLPSSFVQRQSTYLGVYVTASNAASKDASYMLSMMGGWEYDLQRYSNFVVEPNDQMKTLMGLSDSTANDYVNCRVS